MQTKLNRSCRISSASRKLILLRSYHIVVLLRQAYLDTEAKETNTNKITSTVSKFMIRGINQLPYVPNFQSQERFLQPKSIRLQYNMLVLKDKHMMIIQLPKNEAKRSHSQIFEVFNHFVFHTNFSRSLEAQNHR